MIWFILFILLFVLLVFSIINLLSNSSKGIKQSNVNLEHTSNRKHPDFKNRTTYYESKNLVVTQFKIAGVTFKDGRYSRQAALRKLKFQDPPMDNSINFEFEEYEYNGNPAVIVKANNRVLGNIPADYVNEFIDVKNKTQFVKVDYTISGGGDYPFGCRMYVTWRF